MSGRAVYWVFVGVVAASLLGSIGLEAASVQLYSVPSSSMASTVSPGDQVLVAKGSSVRRGDVVVYTDPGPGSAPLMKRVIGLPGDHVACCNSQGKVTINGRALTESYVYPGDAPSMVRFSRTLGSGQVWMMGDHRAESLDSRLRGPVSASAIRGRVAAVIDRGHWRWLHTPAALTTVGLEPADTRLIRLWPLVTAGLCIVVIVGLGVFGLIRLVGRRRGQALVIGPAA